MKYLGATYIGAVNRTYGIAHDFLLVYCIGILSLWLKSVAENSTEF
jgi:hypothetical protein